MDTVDSVNIMVEEHNEENVLVVKGLADSHPISKNARVEVGTPLSKIMNPVSASQTRGRPCEKPDRNMGTKKKSARKIKKTTLTDHELKYNMELELENAPLGITFRQFLRGAEMEARKEIDRLFSSRSAKQKINIVFGALEDHGRRVFKVPRLRVYGIEAFALMDSGAVANVMSKTLVNRLCLTTEEALHTNTVATGVK